MYLTVPSAPRKSTPECTNPVGLFITRGSFHPSQRHWIAYVSLKDERKESDWTERQVENKDWYSFVHKAVASKAPSKPTSRDYEYGTCTVRTPFVQESKSCLGMDFIGDPQPTFEDPF